MVSRCSCDLSHSADRFVHACFFISPLFLSNMASSARALDPLAVTRDNFEEHFHHISSFLLPRTRFISFDTELKKDGDRKREKKIKKAKEEERNDGGR